MSESDLERPAPDSGDERWDPDENGEAGVAGETAGLPMDVNEADAAEQHREVNLDEDDYR